MKTTIILIPLLLFLFLTSGCQDIATQSSSDVITPDDLRCEYLIDPVGIDALNPRLSWISESQQRGQEQTAYRIIVSSTKDKLADNDGDLWDSGKLLSDRSTHIQYDGKPLAPGMQYFWKVKLWDKDGKESGWSEPGTWTTGLLKEENWQARWIKNPSAANGIGKRGLPIFRKSFMVEQPVQRVLVHVTGLGQYELFLNGTKVGDRVLDPAWSVYEKTVYYTTYDITSSVRQGENVFGVMLGKGFYNTIGDRRIHGVDVDRPLKLILQAQIELADGSQQMVATDELWRVTDGPITHSAILGGSDYDARRLPAGWAETGFDDRSWLNAVATNGPGGKLCACTSPPMKVLEVFEPVRIDEPEPGVYLYDFGQNVSAVPRLNIRGKAGQVVRLTPAEQRFGQSPQTNDGRGRVNQAGVGKPNYWEYTLRGGATETWTPQFTYSGFQYVEVTGAVPAGRPNPEGLPVIESLVSCHVRNEASTVGSFSCSNPLLNDIHGMIDWAVRSNMGHVLTDCPHREKLGWLEVSYLMEPSIACRYDIANFYSKVTSDIRDSQDDNGAIYTVAPNYPNFSEGFRYTPEWGAAGVVLPWQIYHRYGDRQVLEDNYETMKRFADYMRETSNDLIPIAGLGDWCDYGHGHRGGYSRFTPFELTAMATFYHCTRIVAETAGLLGNQHDLTEYTALAEQIKTKFNATYFNGVDEYTNYGSPQTANAMALVTGLIPPGAVDPAIERMVEDIRVRGNQQTSGDVGFTYLVKALAKHGRHDVLYDIATRRDIGSYGYFVDHGWPSLPENWDANTDASMNHCMLGHIQQWFYSDLAGIQCDPNAVAFKKIVLFPKLVEDITWVKAWHKSLYGTIRSEWEIRDNRFSWNVTIPPNTTATVCIPAESKKDVTESGDPATKAKGVKFIKMSKDGAWFEVASGNYHFESSKYADYIIRKTIVPVTKISPVNEDITAIEAITMECETEDAIIRYTLDGAEPTEDSREYTGPFTLERSCVVKARAFKEGMKQGYVAKSHINIYDPAVNGLKFEYYLGKWQVLPDFDLLTPEKTGVVTHLDINLIKTREESFGARFSGWTDIPEEGDYTFYLTSDDGSKLFIDNREIVNNDGAHGDQEKSGQIKLKAGKHPIVLEYFQGIRGKSLGLFWEGPGIEKQRVGTSHLFRNEP